MLDLALGLYCIGTGTAFGYFGVDTGVTSRQGGSMVMTWNTTTIMTSKSNCKAITQNENLPTCTVI